MSKYADRDRLMALFAPVGLLCLVPVWLLLVLVGFGAMFWSLSDMSWPEALRVSGSSLLTLGFAVTEGIGPTILEFSEATIGLILIALLIAYLPTMYAAFSRREALVTLLDVRAGSPPTAVEMLERFQRIHGLEQLKDQWQTWETWFGDIEESHTSLPALVFFRSPRPERSWVIAAGAVLNAASLTLSAVDIPASSQAALCIRAGYLALRHISDYFGISYQPDPHYPDQPISVTRAEFDQALRRLESRNVPIKKDWGQAWIDFAGWRVNYDQVLLELANLAMAPEAPWTSKRESSALTPPLVS